MIPDNYLIYKFRTAAAHYIFNVANLNIYRVDAVVWDIIDDCCAFSNEQIVTKYVAKHAEADILRSIGEIADMERSGCLSRKRPEISLHFTSDDIKEMLASKRRSITLSVTDRCNLRCEYCVYSGNYNGRHQLGWKDMSWEIAKKAIDEFFAHRDLTEIPIIGFYGGEPLLNMDVIVKSVEYAKREIGGEVSFQLTTNGTLLKGDAATFIGEHRIRTMVSLDGPQHLHDRYRKSCGGQPTWKLIVDNVKEFLDRCPHFEADNLLTFNSVLAPNLDLLEVDAFFTEFPLFKRFKHLRTFSSFIDSAVNSNRIEGEVVSYDKMYRRYVDLLVDGELNCETYAANKYNFIYPLFALEFLKFHKRHDRYCGKASSRNELPDRYCMLSTCIPGVNKLYVTADGQLFPCERVPELHSLRLGDVETGIDAEVVYKLLDGWVKMAQQECRDCWCLSTCQTGCWRDAFDGKAITTEGKRKACQQHRSAMEQLILDYCSILEKNPHAFDFSKGVVLV